MSFARDSEPGMAAVRESPEAKINEARRRRRFMVGKCRTGNEERQEHLLYFLSTNFCTRAPVPSAT